MNLRTLDLSNNKLTRITGLTSLPNLHTLNVSKNSLATVEDIHELQALVAVKTLDISDNLLDDSPGTLTLLTGVPAMTCLYLKGNPLVKKTKFYRKTVLSTLPQLNYLDDSPVFEQEQRSVRAWATGGREAEMKAKQVSRSVAPASGFFH